MPYSVMLDAGHGGYQLCRIEERSIYPKDLRRIKNVYII